MEDKTRKVTRKELISQVLQEYNRPLTSHDITEAVMNKIEPKITYKKLKRSMDVFLCNIAKSGLITMIKDPKGKTNFYCLPGWDITNLELINNFKLNSLNKKYECS